MSNAAAFEGFSTDDMLKELQRRVRCGLKTEKAKMILVGAPGSGKGTIAPRLKEDYCVCHVSTGDALRDAVKKGTEMGKKAKSVMESGGLVDDSIVIGIIEDALKSDACKGGFVLDGFPRTITQAEKLDQMLAKDGSKIQTVINLEVPDSVLVERVTGRRIHLASGRSYHVKFAPPKVEGKDDITGEALSQRKDDTEETLRPRLEAFHKQTIPVLGHYQSVSTKIDGTQSIKKVYLDVQKILGPAV